MSNSSLSFIQKYLSLVKFSHTIFAMPFAIIGYFLGINHQHEGVQWGLLGLVVLCMVFARSAAMGFNRYIDREFDAANPRTAKREIPAGIVSASSALFFVSINCALFIGTTFLINKMCFVLSPVALMVVLGYSYTKRFTSLCHLVLGLGLSLAPIGAYLAVTNQFALLPVLFSITVFFWVGGFDIIYALQDEQFDKSLSLHSMPARLGTKLALHLSSILHFCCILTVCIIGVNASFGILFWCGLALFAGLLIYQHSIVKPSDLSRVNVAFATTNGIASILFSCFVIAELLYK